MFDRGSPHATISLPCPKGPPARWPRAAASPAKSGLLSWVGAFLLATAGTADVVRAELGQPGLAPAELAGTQFSLDGISSEGVPEGLTLLFRDEREFNATRTVAAVAPLDDSGRYTYQRTGPDTATLTTTSGHPGQESCSTLLIFTSATAGTYTGWCNQGVSSTGQFQLALEDPFCLSLWDGLPCATVANLPQVYLGPLAESTATTEVVIANSDPNPSACEVALLFHQGTAEGPAVSFNGQPMDRNLFQATISREGAEIVTLTAPEAQDLVTGAVYVYARSPCTADSLHVQGRSLIENRTNGEIEELLSIAGQSPQDWMGDGDCRVLTGIFGNGRNVSLASVTTQPGGAAPAGTILKFRTFDVTGKLSGSPSSLTVSGARHSSEPWEFDQPRIIEMCLEVPGTSNFQAAVMAFGSKATSRKTQVTAESFADAFRVGDLTAWSAATASGGN